MGSLSRRTAGRALVTWCSNVTVGPDDLVGFVTAGEALVDLPPVSAGEQVEHYVGPPCSSYQKAMRTGLSHELYNHYAPRLSLQTLKRIQQLAPGRDWRDLLTEMLSSSMRRALRKDHTRRYRRMNWDGVPCTVITRFRDPKTGEYTHPEQHRTLTIREAARLQGPPERFRAAWR
jgi:DNA (cytosine-5)-methyltransferase 1